MKNQEPKNNQLAHFTNDFALHAQMGFTNARQLLLFLALVSQVNPQNEEEEMKGVISLQDIEKLTKLEGAKRSGSLHQEIKDFVEDMMKSNYVKFHTEILWRGQPLPKFITVFDMLEPIEVAQGNVMYKYEFSQKMRPHIKDFLRDFVKLALPRGMKSGHAVRFLMMAKAHHDRLKTHKKITTLQTDVGTLKRVLGIEGKYKAFDNFRRRVVEPMVTAVNQSRILTVVKYEFIRTGRKVTDIKFFLQDKNPVVKVEGEKPRLPPPKPLQNDFIPTSKDEANLTRSQLFAYKYLINRKCIKGIVYRQIVQKVPSSEYIGWEDIFMQKAWHRFVR